MSSCSWYSHLISDKVPVKNNKELLVSYKARISTLRSRIILSESIPEERIKDFYNPYIQGLVVEYNSLAQIGREIDTITDPKYNEWVKYLKSLGDKIEVVEKLLDVDLKITNPSKSETPNGVRSTDPNSKISF
jgi:hypothetical protein